jgi:transcriptional regulator with XRE-family HTH domain
MTTLGIYLRQLRQYRKLSVRALARQAGISHTALSSWEQGKHQPYLPELEAVLKALGATPKQRQEVLSRMDAPRAVHQVRKEIAQQNALYALTQKPPHGGDLLRVMRRRGRMTLEGVAQQIGVQASTLSRWERGETWPEMVLLHALCRLLEASEEEIVALTCGPTLGFRPTTFDEVRQTALGVLRHTIRGARGIEWPLAVHALFPYASQKTEAQILLACLYGDQARHLAEERCFEEAQPLAEKALLLRETLEVSSKVWGQKVHPGWQGAILAQAYIVSFRERAPSLQKGLAALQAGLQYVLNPQYRAWYLSEMGRLLGMVGQPEAAVSVGARVTGCQGLRGTARYLLSSGVSGAPSGKSGTPCCSGSDVTDLSAAPIPPDYQMREQVWQAELLLERGDLSRAKDTLFAVYEKTPAVSVMRWEAEHVLQRLLRK